MAQETRSDRLEETLTRLAEAQPRTEAHFNNLAEVQTRTETRLEAAQLSTERSLDVLAQQVGGLADAVGIGLDSLAGEVTPAYLARHRDIQVASLERHFLALDREEVKIDLYGEGLRADQPISILGEIKSRIHGRDVERSVQRAPSAAPHSRALWSLCLSGSRATRRPGTWPSSTGPASSRPWHLTSLTLTCTLLAWRPEPV